MALINCPECNREISDKAAACPFCGCPSQYFTTRSGNTTPPPVQPNLERAASIQEQVSSTPNQIQQSTLPSDVPFDIPVVPRKKRYIPFTILFTLLAIIIIIVAHWLLLMIGFDLMSATLYFIPLGGLAYGAVFLFLYNLGLEKDAKQRDSLRRGSIIPGLIVFELLLFALFFVDYATCYIDIYSGEMNRFFQNWPISLFVDPWEYFKANYLNQTLEFRTRFNKAHPIEIDSPWLTLIIYLANYLVEPILLISSNHKNKKPR